MTASNPKTGHEECPRFAFCSVNKCPLHIDFLKLESSPFDKEQKCSLAKSIRKRLGAKWKLSNQGMSQREQSGKKRWDALTPEQQEAKREEGRKRSLFLRLSKKGCKIVRVANNNPEKHYQNEGNRLEPPLEKINEVQK